MKVSFIYDQGSSKYREDGAIISPPFFGVLDGVSAPYSPAHPMRMFNRGIWSGGELVSRTVERQLARLSYYHSLEEAIKEANRAVARRQMRHRVPFNGGELAGASLAIAKVTNNWVEIIQACDAFALWVMRDGSLGMTETQNTVSETFLNRRIDEIMVEVANERGVDLEKTDDKTRSEVRGETWNRFYPILLEARRSCVNNSSNPDGYGFLNGQKELEELWFRIALRRSEVSALILFTDGMVPWKGSLEGLATEEVARMVYETYREGGLIKLFVRARGLEEANKATSYMDAAEATAIAIEFD